MRRATDRNEPLQVLGRLTARVSDERVLERGLQSIAATLVDELDSVMVHVLLYVADDGCARCRPRGAPGMASPTPRLHCVARAGLPLEVDDGHIFPDGMPLIDEVMRTRRPIRLEADSREILARNLLPSAEREPRLYRAGALAAFLARPIGTSAIHPLVVGDTVVGVLCAAFARTLSADEVTCLGLCAIQAGAAIERSQLYDRLHGALTVRPATGRPTGRLTSRRAPEGLRDGDVSDEPIGESPIFRALLDRVRQFAATDSTVLLIGETGTGKELVARALHRLSSRAGRPLVTMNCGAIAPGLIESELFGHERGAFTGAVQRRVGRFELADRGTLFLDEIGELPLDGQVKLLRVLQERQFERVGSSQSTRVDVRIIAATNRDLADAVMAGRFRPDLFYRVSVLPIDLPALRDRPADIPILVRHFIAHYRRTLGSVAADITDAALERLAAYRWPGNVRELRNVIERACVLSTGPLIDVDLLRLGRSTDADGSASDPAVAAHGRGLRLADVPDTAGALSSHREHERRYLRRVLVSTGGRIEGANGAAAILEMHPSTLRSRLRRLGLGIARELRAN